MQRQPYQKMHEDRRVAENQGRKKSPPSPFEHREREGGSWYVTAAAAAAAGGGGGAVVVVVVVVVAEVAEVVVVNRVGGRGCEGSGGMVLVRANLLEAGEGSKWGEGVGGGGAEGGGHRPWLQALGVLASRVPGILVFRRALHLRIPKHRSRIRHVLKCVRVLPPGI